MNSNKGSFVKSVSNNLVVRCRDITVSFSEFPVTNTLQGLVKGHYINYMLLHVPTLFHNVLKVLNIHLAV